MIFFFNSGRSNENQEWTEGQRYGASTGEGLTPTILSKTVAKMKDSKGTNSEAVKIAIQSSKSLVAEPQKININAEETMNQRQGQKAIDLR